MSTFDLESVVISTPTVWGVAILTILAITVAAFIVIEKQDRLHNRKMALLLTECRRLALENQFLQAFAAASPRSPFPGPFAKTTLTNVQPASDQSDSMSEGGSAPTSFGDSLALSEDPSTPFTSALSRYESPDMPKVSIFGSPEKTVVTTTSRVDARWTQSKKWSRRSHNSIAA